VTMSIPSKAMPNAGFTVLQVSPTAGELCGIAVFADSTARALGRLGLDVTTVRELRPGVEADVVLVQYHHELTTSAELKQMLHRSTAPVVLMAHSDGYETSISRIGGVLTMVPDLLPRSEAVPALCFPHPALAPARLADRHLLRVQLGLPTDRPFVGTSGFLRFERRLPDVLTLVLPHVQRLGWRVLLTTSPWHRPSPGLLDSIRDLGERWPDAVVHVHRHLNESDLNLHLQACDLLWCWSGLPKSPYASGVVSQMYGSGSAMVVTDQPQHRHVTALPGVTTSGTDMADFVETIAARMTSRAGRHDPSPVSWDRAAEDVRALLVRVAALGPVGVTSS
jgi:hypothetical protein